MPIKKKTLCLFLLLFFINIHAQDRMKDFYKFYNQGKYMLAIENLEGISATKEFEKDRNLWIALSYKNLQLFDKAIPYFKKAIKLGNRNESLFFEYGQCLYAINELDKAKKAFRLSYNTGYKKPYSLYYLANISDILNNPKSTKKNYLRILKDKNADPDIKQIAYFQVGELIYGLIQNKFDILDYTQNYVLPLWKKGIDILPQSELAGEIEQRMDEVMYKFNIHPLQMVNGRRLGKKGYNVKGSIVFENDDNVTLANDQSTTTASDNSSAIIKTNLDMDYRFVYKQRFISTPELKLSYVDYQNDENASVYTNNSYSISTGIANSWEHTLFKKRSSFLLDIDWNYTARDKNQERERNFYSRAKSLTIGEKTRIFKRGATTFKLKFKEITNFSSSQNTDVTTFQMDQLWITDSSNVLIGLFVFDDSKSENTTLNNKSYLFRLDYLLPNLFWVGDLGLNTTLNLIDNYNDSSRDIDQTIILGMRYDKRFSNNIKGSLYYDRTTASSDSVSYDYTKNVMGIELKLSY
tara:strand:+ start:150590 stop:152158 length:1569 start_codon:yes stop_codon:yes gene_type:complete